VDAVDIWSYSDEYEGFDIFKEDKLYKEFIENIEPLKNIINPVRMTSLHASELHEDASLDFVFIDASHKYEDVVNDLKAWYPKVKKGGVFAGHDYPIWEGVKKAVDEFFESNGLEFNSEELCFIHTKP